MNLYIILGKSNHPIANRLFTEKDIEEMKQQPESVNWLFIPVEVPRAIVTGKQIGRAHV